ncbi:MAG: hypothetical protein GXP37_05695 [Chloroflexi bacterium]|nr:hypothetical protein [Chloroflexota bacterium]
MPASLSAWQRVAVIGLSLALLFLPVALQRVHAGNADAPLQVRLLGQCADAAGLGILRFGLGTDATSVNNGTFAVSGIPVAATIAEVWLYWNGADTGSTPEDNPLLFNPSLHDGDPTLTLNGNSVPAPVRLGGPADWVPGRFAYAYKAEVSSIVTGNGNYVLGQMDNLDQYNNGAELVVLYRDAALAPTLIGLAEGLDLAVGNSAPVSGPGTQVVVYAFDADISARVADLNVFLGAAGVSAQNETALWTQTGTGTPPAGSIVLAVGATEVPNPFSGLGNQGYSGYWDSFSQTVTVPAGATWLAVQVESKDIDGPQLEWVGATIALSLACLGVTSTPTPTPTPLPTNTPTPSALSTNTPTPTPPPTKTSTPTPTATPTNGLCVPTPDPYEIDDTAGQATALSPGSTQMHAFNTAVDEDWLIVELIPGYLYTFPIELVGAAAAVHVELRAPDGIQVLAATDVTPAQPHGLINWPALERGFYFLRMSVIGTAYGCDTGYTVAMIELPPTPSCPLPDPMEPNNRWEDAIPLTVNDPPLSLAFEGDGDEDWFKFSAQAGSTYTITTSNLAAGVGGNTDTILFLFLPPQFAEADAVTFSDDFDSTLASRIVWRAETNGVAYIKARDYWRRDSCRSYDLSLDGEYRSYVPLIILPVTTPTPVPNPTLIPTPTPTPQSGSFTIMGFPDGGGRMLKGVAVNSITHRVYASSRNTDTVLVMDGITGQRLAEIPVCDQPFGLEVNKRTNTVYVACFGDANVAIIDGATNQLNLIRHVGPEPTFVAVNEQTNKIFVVLHGINGVAVINGNWNKVERYLGAGRGAFSVAVNEVLNRIYVTNRDDASVYTFDGKTWHELDQQRVWPAQPANVPFALGFNPITQRLYVSFATNGLLKTIAVYKAALDGLVRMATIKVGEGGGDAAGRLGVNPTANHVIVPNTADNTLSVIDGATNTVLATVPVGREPFGIDVDAVVNRIYVGMRRDQSLWGIPDTY